MPWLVDVYHYLPNFHIYKKSFFFVFFLLNYKYQINERKILQEDLKFEPSWQKEKKMDHKIKPTK